MGATAGSDHAVGIAALRKTSDRNFAVMERDIAELREMFDDSDRILEGLLCRDDTPSLTTDDSHDLAHVVEPFEGSSWRHSPTRKTGAS